MPRVARLLLDELADGLADSGPLELGATSANWLRGVDSAQRGLAAANDDSSPKSWRRARRSLRELKGFFGEPDRTWAESLGLVFLCLVFVPLGS